MGLRSKLDSLVEDLTTVEASVEHLDYVAAYTRIEYEGDTINWIATTDDPKMASLIELHSTQLGTATDCRFALLSLSTSIIKSLIR